MGHPRMPLGAAAERRRSHDRFVQSHAQLVATQWPNRLNPNDSSPHRVCDHLQLWRNPKVRTNEAPKSTVVIASSFEGLPLASNSVWLLY